MDPAMGTPSQSLPLVAALTTIATPPHNNEQVGAAARSSGPDTTGSHPSATVPSLSLSPPALVTPTRHPRGSGYGPRRGRRAQYQSQSRRPPHAPDQHSNPADGGKSGASALPGPSPAVDAVVGVNKPSIPAASPHPAEARREAPVVVNQALRPVDAASAPWHEGGVTIPGSANGARQHVSISSVVPKVTPADYIPPHLRPPPAKPAEAAPLPTMSMAKESEEAKSETMGNTQSKPSSLAPTAAKSDEALIELSDGRNGVELSPATTPERPAPVSGPAESPPALPNVVQPKSPAVAPSPVLPESPAVLPNSVSPSNNRRLGNGLARGRAKNRPAREEAKAEHPKADHAKNEHAKHEHAKADHAKTDHAKAEPVKEEHTKAAPAEPGAATALPPPQPSEDGSRDGSIDSNVAVRSVDEGHNLALWDGTWMPPPEWEQREDWRDRHFKRTVKAWVQKSNESVLKTSAVNVRQPEFHTGSHHLEGNELLPPPEPEPVLPHPDRAENAGQNSNFSMLLKRIRVLERKLTNKERELAMAIYKLPRPEAATFRASGPIVNPYAPKANIYLRHAVHGDLAACRNIYNQYVETSVTVPEMEPISLDSVRETYDDVRKLQLPWIVAVERTRDMDRNAGGPPTGGKVVGYGYVDDYHGTTTAFRYTVEMALFAHPNYLRVGVGKVLLDKLLSILDPGHIGRGGYAFVENDGLFEGMGERVISKILCNYTYPAADEKDARWVKKWLERFDFEEKGTLKEIGVKFRKWLNVVHMEKNTSNAILDVDGPSTRY
ncbi:MAG: hypothetical protein M1826_005896 [Phylliscum demangeonii]|nr:MAG: hypothetical protein M1826_005896 [Phylliscum demangeonii]